MARSLLGLPCLPCLPPSLAGGGSGGGGSRAGHASPARGTGDAAAPSSPREGAPGRPVSLTDLDADLLGLALAQVPAEALARLRAACRQFDRIGGDLRTLHFLEAEPLDFVWSGGGGRTASGEDGWGTDFGSSARLPLAANVGRRWRWELELMRHDGLLALGVADGRMQDNAFVGAPGDGRWASWGWELDPRGGSEAVATGTSVVSLAGPEGPARLHLRPARGRRVVLGLHLDARRRLLELIARLQQRPGGPWERLWLDSLRFERPRDAQGDEVAEVRPTVSTNIGATVCLLEQE